ncbi:MAG: tetratricopeptide repeat protein [SAR324 cluster bacterium]|nr:tetratricopeptide repeat protein [SAR324 cluster bacterium]
MPKSIVYLFVLTAFILQSCAQTQPKNDLFANWPQSPSGLGLEDDVIKIRTERLKKIQNLVAQSKLKEAEEMANLGLIKNPNQINLWLTWAKILEAQGQTQRAFDALTTQIKLHPKKNYALVARGLFLFDLGYRESAKNDLERAKSDYQYQASFEMYFGLARVYYDGKNYRQAHQAIRLANVIKDDEEALYLQVKLENLARDTQTAKKTLLKVIALNPEPLEYHQYYIEFLFYLKEYPTLVQHLKESIKRYPDEAWFTLRLASYYLERDDIYTAKEILEDSTGKFSKNASIFYQLAKIYHAERKVDRAIMHYKKAQALEPENDRVLIDLGRIYFQLGKFEEATGYFELARDLGSEKMIVYEALAKFYHQRGDNFEAERTIVQGLRINPKYSTLLNEYGSILEQRGQIQDSIKAYEASLPLHRQRYFVLGKLGNLYRIQKQYVKARTYLNEAMLLRPQAQWLSNHLIQLYRDLKEWDKALFELSKMAKSGKSGYWAHAKIAEIQIILKNNQEALKEANKALELKPDAVWIYQLKAKALTNLKRYPEAQKAYQAVLSKDPNNPILLTLLAYSQSFTDRKKATTTLEQALNFGEFDFAGIELYNYLSGHSLDLWAIAPNSLESKAFKSIIESDKKQTKRLLKKLKNNPIQPYIAYLNDYLQLGKKAELKTSKLKPKTAWQYYYVSSYHYLRAEDHKAQVLMEKAYQLAPENPWITAKLGLIYERQKKHKKAINLLKRHLDQRPESIWIQLRLGSNYDMIQDGINSEKVYLDILAKRPNEHIALNNLAWLYATTTDPTLKKKIGQALALSLKAVDINPNSANLDTLAEIYYLQSDYDKALKAIERALDKDRNSQDYFKRQKKKILKAIKESK